MRNILPRIIKHPLPVLMLAALLTAACAGMVTRTKINYDLSRYLAKDTLTRKTMDILSAEFASTAQIQVMLKNAGDEAAEKYTERLRTLDGVLFAEHNAQDGRREKDGTVYHLITLTMKDEGAAGEALDKAAEVLSGAEYTLGGAQADMRALKTRIEGEIPKVFLIAAAIVVGVLLLTSSSWVEPALFIIVLGVSIVVNMGTNWIFPSVSFITFAVTAILQLALSMDYSIMLLKNFDRLRAQGMPAGEAAANAVTLSAASIASSALTTVAGLLSLTFMSFTIGFDIGMVLSKGILISMLAVFLLMPALLVLFSGILGRTAHKQLPMRGTIISRAALRFARLLSLSLILLIAGAFLLQRMNTYAFMDAGISTASQSISAVFGEKNQLVLVFPRAGTDKEFKKQETLVTALEAMMINSRLLVNEVYSMVTTGAPAVATYTAAEAAELTGMDAGAISLLYTAMGYKEAVRGDTLIRAAAKLMPENPAVKRMNAELLAAESAFSGAGHSRILLDVNIGYGGTKAYEAIENIHHLLTETYGMDTGMAGIAVSSYDIASAFNTDLRMVSLATTAAVFLILAATFRSLILPVVLVGVIQGAIFINMAVNQLIGEPVFFMCYLICIAIQMGATIDYAIVYTANYRLFRKTADKKAALSQAVAASLPTVITSGLIMAIAGFTIGCVSSVYYISSIGVLLGRGAVTSVMLVLFLLSELLYLLDKYGMKGAAPHAGKKREIERG